MVVVDSKISIQLFLRFQFALVFLLKVSVSCNDSSRGKKAITEVITIRFPFLKCKMYVCMEMSGELSFVDCLFLLPAVHLVY